VILVQENKLKKNAKFCEVENKLVL